MAPIMEQNGNGALVDSVPAPVTDPVGTQNENEHLRIDAKRLFQKLRGLKGHLTREVKTATLKLANSIHWWKTMPISQL